MDVDLRSKAEALEYQAILRGLRCPPRMPTGHASNIRRGVILKSANRVWTELCNIRKERPTNGQTGT